MLGKLLLTTAAVLATIYSTSALRDPECQFPFTYQGVTYDSCTDVNHDRLWCSLTADYQGQWKNCDLAPVDIVLTLDLSSSISRTDHNAAKNFMDSFHQCSALYNVQIAIVLYNCVPWTHVTLGEFPVGSGILMYRIVDIEYTGGRTRTSIAVRHVTATSDFRDGSKRAAIFLTDGKTEDPAGMATQAAAALAADINLYGVGVGTFASQAGLQSLTGDPSRIYSVNDDPCAVAQQIMYDLND